MTLHCTYDIPVHGAYESDVWRNGVITLISLYDNPDNPPLIFTLLITLMAQVGMYFKFLIFYDTWLLYLGIPGTAMAIYQYTRVFDSLLIPVFCVYTSMWAGLFLKQWCRVQVSYITHDSPDNPIYIWILLT